MSRHFGVEKEAKNFAWKGGFFICVHSKSGLVHYSEGIDWKIFTKLLKSKMPFLFLIRIFFLQFFTQTEVLRWELLKACFHTANFDTCKDVKPCF